MPTLWKNILGVFILDSGEVVEKILFSKDPKEVASKLSEECKEEKELKGKFEGLNYKKPDLTLSKISEKFNVFESQEELFKFVRDVSREFSEIKIEESEGKDKELIEEVKSLDELKEVENKLKERFDSWKNIYNTKKDFVEFLNKSCEDLENLKEFEGILDDVKELQENLEGHIEDRSREVAPNLSELLGPLLTGRILSLAGSLEKLSKMPSSTVQVLGAEKALFRYMKGEGTAPKHGIIFLHPLVNQAPNDERGKIARTLANKISIAARLDFYGNKYKGDKLRQEVKDKFEEVKK